jgi:glycosyltransferase involved in cell wall biosynthesis
MPNFKTRPHPILFISATLGGGGAERALVNIINHLDRNKFSPNLVLFRRTGEFLDEIAKDVPIYELQSSDSRFLLRNFTRIRKLSQLFLSIKPRLVMSLQWHVNIISLLAIKPVSNKVSIIINHQNTPSMASITDNRRKKLWPAMKWVYRWADRVVIISRGIAHELQQNASVNADKLVLIPNPISLDRIYDLSKEKVHLNGLASIIAISVGRLVPQKNYPLLIKAIALVLVKHKIELFILGQGPEEERINQLAQELGIRDHIHLLGFKSNPYAYMKKADLFIISSLYEGFGNVIIEAMSLGLPVISTDCPYGPAEILGDSEYGKLVTLNDANALAQAIIEFIDHPVRRQHYSKLGKKRAQEYDVINIIPKYENLFLRLIEQ